jgi:hydroxymethylpyrimidine/phosphomethylpyrimidine kinase
MRSPADRPGLAEYILITGAHEQGAQVSNTLYNTRGIVHRLNWDRLPGSYHGSGCTLASAVAALLALGQDVSEAVKEAQEYTYQTLKNAYRPGMGQFIPDRLYWVRGDDDE